MQSGQRLEIPINTNDYISENAKNLLKRFITNKLDTALNDQSIESNDKDFIDQLRHLLVIVLQEVTVVGSYWRLKDIKNILKNITAVDPSRKDSATAIELFYLDPPGDKCKQLIQSLYKEVVVTLSEIDINTNSISDKTKKKYLKEFKKNIQQSFPASLKPTDDSLEEEQEDPHESSLQDSQELRNKFSELFKIVACYYNNRSWLAKVAQSFILDLDKIEVAELSFSDEQLEKLAAEGVQSDLEAFPIDKTIKLAQELAEQQELQLYSVCLNKFAEDLEEKNKQQADGVKQDNHSPRDSIIVVNPQLVIPQTRVEVNPKYDAVPSDTQQKAKVNPQPQQSQARNNSQTTAGMKLSFGMATLQKFTNWMKKTKAKASSSYKKLMEKNSISFFSKSSQVDKSVPKNQHVNESSKNSQDNTATTKQLFCMLHG